MPYIKYARALQFDPVPELVEIR